MAASSPLSAEILSAKRQFIGILGLDVPLNWTLFAHSAISAGSVGAIRGFFNIPLSNTCCVSLGTE